MKKDNIGNMKNQSTVGDTDGNNSDVIICDVGITTDLYFYTICYNDIKDTQPDPRKQKNNYVFEDILNMNKNDTIETKN